MRASNRGTAKTDRLAQRVPATAHDAIAGGVTSWDLSKAHRHPWGSAHNVRNQIRITLEKLAVIPPAQRDARIREAEDLLREASGPADRAAALLAAYYDVGRGVHS